MIKEAIEKIVSMAAPSLSVIQGDDRTFKMIPGRGIEPLLDAQTIPIECSTLSGLKEYLYSGAVFKTSNFAFIKSPTCVELTSEIFGANLQRNIYIRCTHDQKQFPFGIYQDPETFIVGIQTYFVQDEMTAAILKVAGNIVHESTSKTLDDGVTQTVTAKTGIARVENVTVPNPVTLHPYRTFTEVSNQPAGLFVFRIKQDDKGPKCALHEVDSGLWKIEAINEIKAWIRKSILDLVVVG